jgi:hypothetical protein
VLAVVIVVVWSTSAPVLGGEICLEVSDLLRDTIEPEPVQQASEVVGERLSLSQNWEERARPTVDEAGLRRQPPVDVIDIECNPGCEVNELSALWRELVRSPERGHQFVAEGDHVASGGRSAVDGS